MVLWGTAQILFPGIFTHHWLLKSDLAHSHTRHQGWPPWLVDVGTKVCHLAWIWNNAEGLSSCGTAGGWTRPLVQLPCSRALHPVPVPVSSPIMALKPALGTWSRSMLSTLEILNKQEFHHMKLWNCERHIIVHNFKEKQRRQNRKPMKIHTHTHTEYIAFLLLSVIGEMMMLTTK